MGFFDLSQNAGSEDSCKVPDQKIVRGRPPSITATRFTFSNSYYSPVQETRYSEGCEREMKKPTEISVAFSTGDQIISLSFPSVTVFGLFVTKKGGPLGFSHPM